MVESNLDDESKVDVETESSSGYIESDTDIETSSNEEDDIVTNGNLIESSDMGKEIEDQTDNKDESTEAEEDKPAVVPAKDNESTAVLPEEDKSIVVLAEEDESAAVQGEDKLITDDVESEGELVDLIIIKDVNGVINRVIANSEDTNDDEVNSTDSEDAYKDGDRVMDDKGERDGDKLNDEKKDEMF